MTAIHARRSLWLVSVALATFVILAPAAMRADDFEDEEYDPENPGTAVCCPDYQCTANSTCYDEGWCEKGNKCTVILESAPNPRRCKWVGCF